MIIFTEEDLTLTIVEWSPVDNELSVTASMLKLALLLGSRGCRLIAIASTSYGRKKKAAVKARDVRKLDLALRASRERLT